MLFWLHGVWRGDRSTEEQEAIFFHELSHIAGTDDATKKLLDEADWYERLYTKGTFDEATKKSLRTMAKLYCEKHNKPKK